MGAFNFMENTTGLAMDPADFIAAAEAEPMSMLSTALDAGTGNLADIYRQPLLPAEAPITRGVFYTPPETGDVPDPASIPTPGLVSPGNIDLRSRPTVRNPDGTVSTVRSMSFNEDGREILVPTVSDDGRIMTDDEAVQAYRATGRNLGIFDTPENATAYAEALHLQQEAQSAGGREVFSLGTRQMRARLAMAGIAAREESDAEFEARRAAAGAISEEQFKASAAYRDGIKWDAGMTTARAEAMAEAYDDKRRREFYAEKRPISAFTGQFFSEFGNVANYVPFAGPAVRAAQVARFGRIGGAAVVGSIDAVAGTAVQNALLSESRATMGEDVSWQAGLSDLAMSAAVGGLFGSAFGYLGRRADARVSRAREEAELALSTLPKTQETLFVLDDAVTAVANGEPINLSPASQAFLQGAIDQAVAAVRRVGESEILAAPALARHRVAAADGSSIDVIPRVVEARDLITSNDAGFDATLQPRQRDRAAAQAQIRQIASSLDPQRLGASAEADRGAPIIGPDRMVESGNGRVMALREVYRAGGEKAQAYRTFLEQQGADLTGFTEPVLVRVRATSLDAAGRQAFAVAANRPATLAMSATERARADAAALTPDTMALLRNPEDLGGASNIGFVRQFLRTLPQSEAGALTLPDGRVSAEGLARVRNAVLSAAYEDADTLARITEATDDGVKSISNALTSAAPTWAGFRRDILDGRVPKALDTTSALLEAVKRTADIRARGVKLDDALKQVDAFDTMPESVEGFMRLFYAPDGRRAASGERIATGLKRYASEARKVSTDEGLGLGLDPIEVRDLMALIRRESDGGSGETGQLGFGDPAAARDGSDAGAGGGVPGRPTDAVAGLQDAGPGRAGDQGEGFRTPSVEDGGAGGSRRGEGEASATQEAEGRGLAPRATPEDAADGNGGGLIGADGVSRLDDGSGNLSPDNRPLGGAEPKQAVLGPQPASIEDARVFREAAPERDLDQLYREIPRHQDALDDAGREVAEALGLKFKTPGLKDREGAAEKMTRKGYRSTRQLTDLVRGGFAAKEPGDVSAIVSDLAKRFDVMDEGWSRAPSGYIDRKVLVRFDDGTVGEVQIWEPNLLEAKSEGGGHDLYKRARDLPDGDPQKAALEAEQRELYAAALARSSDAWRAELSGSAGSSPNILLKASSGRTDPLSPTSDALTAVQSSPGASTANALDPSVTAGRASQFTNVQAIEPSLFPDEARRLDMGTGRPLVDPAVLQAADRAGARVGKAEDSRALAEQFGVDPKTGAFDEMAELDQVRTEGRLSPEDEAELRDADDAFNVGSAYGDAMQAAVGCLL